LATQPGPNLQNSLMKWCVGVLLCSHSHSHITL
jgi:hypothetical protein